MPIFISYSHADKTFVDQLAVQLVAQKVHVWLDRWEINVGDSLIEKIQEAITGSSALLVILSDASVKSEWCKKELNSGLMRELEEKRVLVLPVLKEKCQIPLFLREKMYADFTEDFDHGLTTILESIARVTTDTQGRIEEPRWHTDWGIDWGVTDEGLSIFRLPMVETALDQPYVILSIVEMLADNGVSDWYLKQTEAGKDHFARRDVVRALAKATEHRLDLDFLLEDAFERHAVVPVTMEQGMLVARITVRRLGVDNGRDTLFRVPGQLDGIAQSIEEVVRNDDDERLAREKRSPKKATKKKSTKRPAKTTKSSKKVTTKKNAVKKTTKAVAQKNTSPKKKAKAKTRK